MEFTSDDVEQWRFKKLLTFLKSCRGNGTSMITLYIPPNQTTNFAMQQLVDEYGTATNIKSKVNKDSVLEALRSAQNRLKLYPNKAPANGLVILCGNVVTADGKSKKINLDIVPIKPCNYKLYKCDNIFHLDKLEESLTKDHQAYGFVIVNGNGCLLATINGNQKSILARFDVNLPSKTGRGGQSANRFAHLREEARYEYIKKVASIIDKTFLDREYQCHLAGLIIAGNADVKNVLVKNFDLVSNEIRKRLLGTIDITYGFEAGFNEAIEQSKDLLKENKLVKERELLKRFFESIALADDMYLIGPEQTLRYLELGAVESIICWEDLTTVRYVYEDSDDPVYRQCPDRKVVSEQLLTEWLADHYQEYGVKLYYISDSSSEGYQFCKGFGGIGGLLRYKIDLEAEEYSGDDYEEDEEEYI